MKTVGKKIAIEGLVPFTRTIWKNKEAKEEWQDKLRRASNIYHIAEWKMVAEGKRRCGTIHINKQNFESMLTRLTEDGLYFNPIARTAKYAGFSHRHITPRVGEDYDVYGVLALNREDAIKFAKASGQGTDHRKIGDLLGYPKCCQDAFVDRWSRGIIDPVFEAANEAMSVKMSSDTEVIELTQVPIETHQMLRYFGLRMTSHLPCSVDCEDTIRIGQIWKEVMKQTNSQSYKYLEELMKMPLRWDTYRGILIVTTPIFRGVTTSGFTKNKRVIKVGDVLGW